MKTKTTRKLAAVNPSVIPTGPTEKPATKPAADPVRPDSPKPTSTADAVDPGEAGPGRGGARPGAGRPPKVPPKLPEFTEAGLARLWQLGFGMIAVRKQDEDWQLDDDEAANLAKATDPVLQQYLPLIGDHAALVALGITLALTVAPRYMLDQAKRKAAKGSKPAVEDQDAGVKIVSRTRPKPGSKGKSKP